MDACGIKTYFISIITKMQFVRVYAIWYEAATTSARLPLPHPTYFDDDDVDVQWGGSMKIIQGSPRQICIFVLLLTIQCTKANPKPPYICGKCHIYKCYWIYISVFFLFIYCERVVVWCCSVLWFLSAFTCAAHRDPEWNICILRIWKTCARDSLLQ